jgi:pre-mRNA-splicing factor ATP-dependent RNA helicase DHX15/PRP43
MNETERVRKQLTDNFKRVAEAKWDVVPYDHPNYFANLRRALALSFFNQMAMSMGGRDYYTTANKGQPALLHPDSAMVEGDKPYQRNPQWVVFTEFGQSGKQYIENVTAIEPEWVAHLPYFKDENLAKKKTGGFKQPKVQERMAKARAVISKQLKDQAAGAGANTIG